MGVKQHYAASVCFVVPPRNDSQRKLQTDKLDSNIGGEGIAVEKRIVRHLFSLLDGTDRIRLQIQIRTIL